MQIIGWQSAWGPTQQLWLAREILEFDSPRDGTARETKHEE
jgi:hypothetical protein